MVEKRFAGSVPADAPPPRVPARVAQGVWRVLPGSTVETCWRCGKTLSIGAEARRTVVGVAVHARRCPT